MDFLEGWKDNKVRALFFGDRPNPPLRLPMASFMYRKTVKVGYVHVNRYIFCSPCLLDSVPILNNSLNCHEDVYFICGFDKCIFICFSISADEIKKKYGVQFYQETLLMFTENINVPVATVSVRVPCS